MDIIDAYKIKERMCNSFKSCKDCPMASIELNEYCDIDRFPLVENINAVRGLVQVLQNWNEKHPAITLQNKFMELIPSVNLTSRGDIDLCPVKVTSDVKCNYLRDFSSTHDCDKCKHEFWSQEVDDE